MERTPALRPRVSPRLHQRWRWFPFPIRLWAARWRANLARYRLVRRGTISLLIAVAALTWISAVANARTEKQQWGELVSVVVVDEAVEIGDPVDGGVTSLTQIPSSILPPDAVSDIPLAGATARVALAKGDILRQRDITGNDVIGMQTLAVANTALVPPLATADRVQLYLSSPHLAAQSEGQPIASSVPARVVAVDPDVILLAVPGPDAGRVAEAIRRREIVVAVASAGDR